MENNEYYLELPEHLRHLVAKDAPIRAQAALVEFEGGGEKIPLLAGAWQLSARQKRQQYRVQVFLTNREATSFMWLPNFSKQHISKEDYENYPTSKINRLISDVFTDRIERYFSIKGTGDSLKLVANRQTRLYGAWVPRGQKNRSDSLFLHQLFASYREFFELSDEVVLERILVEMQDDTSEINLAHRWSKMDEDEQAIFAFQCKNGTWNEIRALFQSLLVIMATQAKTQGALVWFLGTESFYCDDDIDTFESQWLSFIKSWQDKIHRHCKPEYFLGGQRQPLCISSWNNRHQPVVALPPTAHELLEAQLKLSKWAHKNLSSEEAKALLQFD